MVHVFISMIMYGCVPNSYISKYEKRRKHTKSLFKTFVKRKQIKIIYIIIL